jgi:hypothetical protein
MIDDAFPDLALDPAPDDGQRMRVGRHRRSGRPVVVKLADPNGDLDRATDLLLAAEHPGVLQVLDHRRGDAVVVPRLPDTLGGLLTAHGSLPPRATAQLVLELCDALHHLHLRGLVHGDLSPGNVLVHADGHPVLADPSPAVGPDPAATAGYAAPELAVGAPPTPATDLHALGVLGLECLGREDSHDLRAVLLGAADPDPSRRPESAARLARQIIDAAPGTSWLDRALVLPSEPSGPGIALPPTVTRTFGPRPPRPPRPRPADTGGARSHLRRAAQVGAALAAVGLAVLATVAAIRAGAGPGCEALSTSPSGVTGDLDGDGCEEQVAWDPARAVLRLPGGRRLQVGEPGDQLLLGDWDCDRTDTPALYRPSTGEVYEFSSWVSGDDALSSSETHPTGVHDGTPRVVPPTGAGCDRVAVEP